MAEARSTLQAPVKTQSGRLFPASTFSGGTWRDTGEPGEKRESHAIFNPESFDLKSENSAGEKTYAGERGVSFTGSCAPGRNSFLLALSITGMAMAIYFYRVQSPGLYVFSTLLCIISLFILAGRYISWQRMLEPFLEKPGCGKDYEQGVKLRRGAALLLSMTLGILAMTVMGISAKLSEQNAVTEFTTGDGKSVHSAKAERSGFPAASCTDNPAQFLVSYYSLINSRELSAAYDQQSTRIKNKGTYEDFMEMWVPNEAVYAYDAEVVSISESKALVRIKLVAHDPDESGKVIPTPWQGMVSLVYENGCWRYDGGDFRQSTVSQTSDYRH